MPPMDSGSGSSADSRDLFKDLEEIFWRMFLYLSAMLVYNWGNAEVNGKHYYITAYPYAVMAKSLFLVLHALFRQPIPNPRSIICTMLLRILWECAVCFIVLALISVKHALIILAIWVLTFILVVKFHVRLANFSTKVSEKISQIFEIYFGIQIPVSVAI
ncbi:hypothetical protein L195_g041543 [Trifolium pratense]|uniref:Uncharacterized protein n=1 Tax=Trifolium pratense TaxID=57577 RepID=A0A2K3M3Y1_TRIPR|nr:hypothetical protein L195_g041543 [Trifolium pratense]